jgi:hypothetical protein
MLANSRPLGDATATITIPSADLKSIALSALGIQTNDAPATPGVTSPQVSSMGLSFGGIPILGWVAIAIVGGVLFHHSKR